MEAGLDNANNATNNPFVNSNGTNEILQQKEGFLLNLTENFKQNGGAELSPSNDYVYDRPANGKRPAEEFDEDEDMGPETDVDTLDDALLSPASEQTSTIDNKNLVGAFDPFTAEMEEKATLEMDLNIQKQQTSEFDPPRIPREETPTPPADEVHDAGVEENVADSAEDSEDEWNYYKGDTAESEKVSSSKADQEVAALTRTAEEDEDKVDDDDNMSQLNPNAAEFVPISSPTRNVVSPTCRALMNEQVIAQSPRRATPTDIDINLPNERDFEKEVKSRPSDLFSNGEDDENLPKLSSQEVMENFLNGKNIDEIEFHPGTPHKVPNPEEFHFGPNATPFSTPAKLLDQSEAALSTKAVFGDESSYLEGKALNFETSFTMETTTTTTTAAASEDVGDFRLNKPTDPMSMSYYQDESETNPFDLNKVQMLPDDDDKQENNSFNETMSDLPEHEPLAKDEPVVTDLDKPVEVSGDANVLCGVSQLPQSPEPCLNMEGAPKDDVDDLIACSLPPAKSPILIEASKAPLPITPEPNSEEQEGMNSAPKTPEAVSPLPQDNLLIDTEKRPDSVSPIPPEFAKVDIGIEPLVDNSELLIESGVDSEVLIESGVDSELLIESGVDSLQKERITPVAFSPEPTDELNKLSKSPEPTDELNKLSKSPEPLDELNELSKSPEPLDELNELSKSPEPTMNLNEDDEILQQTLDALIRPDSKSPALRTPEPTEELLCQSKSPEPATLEDKSPIPTPEPTTESCEDVVCNILEKGEEVQEEFFPICQKSVEPEERAVIKEGIAVEEEFFPICSKPSAEAAQTSTLDQFSDLDNLCQNVTNVEEVTQIESHVPIDENLPKSPIPNLEVDIEQLDVATEAAKSPIPDIEQSQPEVPLLDVVEDQVKSLIADVAAELPPKSPEVPKVEETQAKSPIPAEEDTLIECQIKSPELGVDVLAEVVEAKSPEPLTDITENRPLSAGDILVESDIKTEIETEAGKSPTPRDEDVLVESETRSTEIILDDLKEQATSPEPNNDIPLLKEDLTIEECVAQSPEPITESFEIIASVPDNDIAAGPIHKTEEVVHVSEQTLIDEIQNILDSTEAMPQVESEAKSPETIEESLDSEKRDLESPMEDITSSVKDDNSMTPEIIEEAKDISTEKEGVRVTEPEMTTAHTEQQYTHELSSAMQEINELLSEKDTLCQISSTPNTTISEQNDTESVRTADVNSILERSNMPDITSPLSATEQSLEKLIDAQLEDTRPKSPLPTEEVIKTDLIAPQYPEETVITPSEETKVEITPTVEEKEAPAALPEVALEAQEKEKADETAVIAAVGATAAVATVAAVTAAAVKEKKTTSKPLAKVTPTAAKSSKPGQSPTKTTSSKPATGRTPSAKPALSSPTKPVPAKTAKTTTTTLKAPPKAIPKASPKPKTEAPAPKVTEKKLPMMNGDVKPPARAPVAAKKTISSTTTKSSLTAKAPLAPKPSPNKTETKTTLTKTNLTTTKLSTTGSTLKSTATSKTMTTTTASKPRPTSLPGKTTPSSTRTTPTVSATKSTVQSKTTTTASSPRTATAKPKQPSTTTRVSLTSATAKPKTSATKLSATKGPDTEKEIKESVNKQLTASRSTTTTRTSGTLATGKTTTTVKKTEMKSPSTRTSTTKTTITSIKAANKKPTEVTRITAKKTGPTKTTVLKTQQSELTNGITTIVQETTTILSTTEPQLIKDMSPIENKLIVDNSQLSESTKIAD